MIELQIVNKQDEAVFVILMYQPHEKDAAEFAKQNSGLPIYWMTSLTPFNILNDMYEYTSLKNKISVSDFLKSVSIYDPFEEKIKFYKPADEIYSRFGRPKLGFIVNPGVPRELASIIESVLKPLKETKPELELRTSPM